MDQETQQKLEIMLIQGEFISQKQLQEAVTYAKKNATSLEEALISKDFVKDDEMGQLVCQIMAWQFVNLSKEGIDESIAHLIPERVAKKQKTLAFARTDDGIKIAMNNPDDTNFLHLLEKKLGEKLIPYFATLKDIHTHLDVYKTDIREEFEKIIKAEAAHAVIGESKESSTIQIVDMLLQRGFQNKASDIHIEPGENETQVRFRIDGVMHDVISIPAKIHDVVISRIKVMSHLRTDEHQVPQDGKIEYNIDNHKLDVRVSVVPTTKGENVVMRLLSDQSREFTLEDIGLGAKDHAKLSEAIKKPWGMILVTGPTGSGKTTSLYSVMKILNRREVNIATIEDPVEYNVSSITQIQVNPKAELTFASGLRSIVRQDPDIIMVGEIRDEETANISINAAMTGHLVLSTLHTNDAATTIPRIKDMGVEPFLIASTINVVIAQRLVRKICSKCIQSYETDLLDLQGKMPISALEKLARGKDKITLYKGAGCAVCNDTGYSGRIGVFEVMEVDDEVRKLIMDEADADQIKAKAVEGGMTTMFDDAREKVLNGQTTIEEMMRVIRS
ncbi:type II/IV secretion system protein [Candidatus Gracilibacteria bacterium]|nr:type II/IV secretion system protein [Candidatus Gracilibacteria bacterium]